ncbi:hypothetical protein O181_070309, partial [Austropuccinia psidii MF-1]|nr:hypothetical protein [Austropuccinia psidii MF-1]
MASGNHQRPPDQLSQPSPQLTVNPFHSFIPSVLKVAGPISIFPYQSLKIKRPFQRRIISAHQSDKLWRQSEDSSRIPTTCICKSWVGKLFRIIQKGNSQEVLHQFNQLSRHQVFQYSLDNSIHPYRPHSINLYGLGPIGPFHITHVGYWWSYPLLIHQGESRVNRPRLTSRRTA